MAAGRLSALQPANRSSAAQHVRGSIWVTYQLSEPGVYKPAKAANDGGGLPMNTTRIAD
jgi:hypothetical protein